MKVERREVRQR